MYLSSAEPGVPVDDRSQLLVDVHGGTGHADGSIHGQTQHGVSHGLAHGTACCHGRRLLGPHHRSWPLLADGLHSASSGNTTFFSTLY